MILLIDNYDSFTHTLTSYLRSLGATVRCVRNDRIDIPAIERLRGRGLLSGIVLSPGPGRPDESGICPQAVRTFAGRVPMLGVCLGHQVIAEVLGGSVRLGARPMHGEVTPITTTGQGLFAPLPRRFKVTRYHSLSVQRASLPPSVAVDAWADDGAVMALRHLILPLFGVQFHPEALLTEHGCALLAAFLTACDATRAQRAAAREQGASPLPRKPRATQSNDARAASTPQTAAASAAGAAPPAGNAGVATIPQRRAHRTLVEPLAESKPLSWVFELVHHTDQAVFLDSAQQGPLGRHSVVGLLPSLCLEARNGMAYRNGRRIAGSFEDALDRALAERAEENPTDLPLIAGAIGFVSYDHGRGYEQLSSRHAARTPMPDARFTFYELLVVEDHATGQLWACAQEDPADPLRARRLVEYAQNLVSRAVSPPVPARTATQAAFRADLGRAGYEDAVGQLIEHIRQGRTYIANLSRRLEVREGPAPYDAYRYLRTHSPAPFAAYLNGGSWHVACASMERFLQVRGGRVVTRPIKGTRPRGSCPQEDADMRRELETSAKELSELLMVVDLERNDLCRVCEPGSAQVPAHAVTEAYATVFHLVSTVEGRLRAGMGAGALLRATFPGGSITGAPKVETMRIIDRLERSARGLYTGSIGYLACDGDIDLNIVIRTAVHEGDRWRIGVGGGITAQSEASFEYDETLVKARALLEALNAPGSAGWERGRRA
ncbi:aminodeoxychorismate synthase component I [Berryella wangjianweii]|nr:aminodeoxychorismate synthase component I [Berryella wangjianweii]